MSRYIRWLLAFPAKLELGLVLILLAIYAVVLLR